MALARIRMLRVYSAAQKQLVTEIYDVCCLRAGAQFTFVGAESGNRFFGCKHKTSELPKLRRIASGMIHKKRPSSIFSGIRISE